MDYQSPLFNLYKTEDEPNITKCQILVSTESVRPTLTPKEQELVLRGIYGYMLMNGPRVMNGAFDPEAWNTAIHLMHKFETVIQNAGLDESERIG